MLVYESAYSEESDGIMSAVIFYGLEDKSSDSLVAILFFFTAMKSISLDS